MSVRSYQKKNECTKYTCSVYHYNFFFYYKCKDRQEVAWFQHPRLPAGGAAAAATSLQSCPTPWPHRLQPSRLLCPWDSPATILEWVAISFSTLQFLNGEKRKKTAKWFLKVSILYLWPNKNLFKADEGKVSFERRIPDNKWISNNNENITALELLMNLGNGYIGAHHSRLIFYICFKFHW